MKPTDKTLEQKRTIRQNKALHVYLTLIAHELSNQGQTMQSVVKKLDFCEITPTKESVKSVIWKPIQEMVVGKKLTRELNTAEINKVYEIVSMFLSKQFQISLPFPSEEQTQEYLSSLESK